MAPRKSKVKEGEKPKVEKKGLKSKAKVPAVVIAPADSTVKRVQKKVEVEKKDVKMAKVPAAAVADSTVKTQKLRKSKAEKKVLKVKKVPAAAADTAVKHVQKLMVKKEEAAVAKASRYKRGIILLNHIPHGFYEEEMRNYFSQFGKVMRLRLARSPKTGKSKGYAFIEFEFEEIAKIVQEAMDGYLMYERLMKCEVLPSTVNARAIFSTNYFREDNYPKLRTRIKVKEEQNKPKSDEDVKAMLEFRLKKLEEQNKKWAELGINYKYMPPALQKTNTKSKA